MDHDTIESLLQYRGPLKLEVGGRVVNLDLRFRHERAYATKVLFGLLHPQADIDTLLFNRVVRQGDAVLDAGAHVGFTALTLLSAGAGKVVALEPVPSIFSRLNELAGTRLVAIHAALSMETGQSKLLLSSSHNQGSSLNETMVDVFPAVFGEHPETAMVRTISLDDLVLQHGAFDVWKLDIEGAEADALRGASHTLARQPPRAIIVELYERFFGEFNQLIRPSHPHAYRGFIRKSDGALIVLPVAEAPAEEVHTTSPMYLFLQEPMP